MPDFSKPEHILDLDTTAPTEKKKNPIDNLKNSKAKKLLSKVNRPMNCIFCETERILNPQQYQAYYDYWGDEDKIKRNFVCKPCEVKQNDNPFLFWLTNHEMVKRLTTNFLQQNKIDSANMEFILENQLPVAIKIKNMPFVGTFEFRPYTEEKIKL